jgi:hypothetical protein
MAITKIPAAGFTGNNFRNIIINGDMSIAQRGTSSTGITTSGYYTVDRFNFSLSSIGTWTISQDTDVPTGQGFAKSLKMDCTTADASPATGDRIFIRTMFEGQNLQHLKKGTSSAESLTLSFWVKSNKTGTYILELFDHDNTRHINKSYTISSASTWEKKIITIDGDTTGAFTNDNNLSLHVAWWLGAGSTYTTGSLQTSWGSLAQANRGVGQVNLADSTSNYINITGVQLEAGTSASDFEFLPYDVNLGRCQRYFIKYTGITADQTNIGTGFFYSTAVGGFIVSLPNNMRSAPTMSGNNLNVRHSNTASDVTVGGTFDYGEQIVSFNATASSGSPFTIGQGAIVRLKNLTTAFLQFDSEL